MAKAKEARPCVFRIDTRIYPLRVIYSSAYLFLEKAYVFLRGDPGTTVTVSIRAKNGTDSRRIAAGFRNELLNAALRQQIAQENKKLREYIVGSALLSVSEARTAVPAQGRDDCGCRTRAPVKSSHTALNLKSAKDNTDGERGKLHDETIPDPFGIRIPWEEKYGKDDPGKV